MTKQEVYEQLVRLTTELKSLNLAQRIFDAVETGNPEEVQSVFESFKKENSKMYLGLVKFGEEFNKLELDEVDTNKRLFVNGILFDENVIDALSLYILTFFAKIKDYYLFNWTTESADRFVLAIKKAGYEKLSEFIREYSWLEWIGEGRDEYPDIYICNLLIDIFKGKIE